MSPARWCSNVTRKTRTLSTFSRDCQMRKLRLDVVLSVFSQEHASPVYGVRRETGDATHRLDQLMVFISHLEFFFQFHFVR